MVQTCNRKRPEKGDDHLFMILGSKCSNAGIYKLTSLFDALCFLKDSCLATGIK